jgi:hypothetical protein
MSDRKRGRYNEPELTRNRRRKGNNSNEPPDNDPFITFITLLGKQINDDDKNAKITKPVETIVCNNPLCNHLTFEEDETPPTVSNIASIDLIDDIIELGKTYHCKKNKEYHGLNLRILCDLVPSLTELKNMIGMDSVKQNIVNHILFFVNGFNKNSKCTKCINCINEMPCTIVNNDMMHTVITGPPGTGKTTLGKILGKVYRAMGILNNGDMRVVSRVDLIAGFVGQTAIKTQDVIDSCKGGVLFIDEAYSLGDNERRDTFSKECLDTLNRNLSENRDFLCIIAGYEDNLEKCFFSANEGLRRRFTFRYNIDKYTSDELHNIFELKVTQDDWKLYYGTSEKERNKITQFFSKNSENFPNYGGDIETLLLHCKIRHGRRIMSNPAESKTLSHCDIEHGFKEYLKNRKYGKINVGKELIKTTIYRQKY